MKYFNQLIFLALLLIIGLNIFSTPPQILRHQVLASSLSRGDRYYGQLQLWYDFARVGDWQSASQLEPLLDPSDISQYKRSHHPSELKKYLNTLLVKPNKSVADWVELARIQAVLGRSSDVTESLQKARLLDPVRDDLSRLYYQSLK